MNDVTISFSCKHCKFLKDGHWTDNWGNLTLENTALPAGTESRHEFLVHKNLLSLRKQPSFFAPGLSGVSREGRLRFTAENSILMTQIFPESGHER